MHTKIQFSDWQLDLHLLCRLLMILFGGAKTTSLGMFSDRPYREY